MNSPREGWALEDKGYNRAKVRHYWIPCDPPPWVSMEHLRHTRFAIELADKQWHTTACNGGGITSRPMKWDSRARRCSYCARLHPEEEA